MKIRNQKSETGITLVALIITIIILIILAGVTLNITLGQNGIFQKSKEAVDMHKDAAQREESELDKTLGDIESASSGIYVPEGFKHTEGSIDTGYVIQNTETEDEFVWIPVEVPAVNSEEKLAEAINNGQYPMAVKTSEKDQYGRDNYRGVLYSFDINEAGDGVKIEVISYNPTSSYREPANLSETYDSKSKIPEWTETLYQEEYNELVESVIENKGFYIGRYESGNLGENETAVSTKDAKGISSQTWYQMYKAQKNIYGPDAEAKTHMIWGSQYDQVLIWMKDVENLDASSKKFYILDSTNMGVYSNNKSTYWDATTGKFEVKNVYDLAGNVYDWTMEADRTNGRVFHGGSCNGVASDNPASYRNYGDPTLKRDYYGSRLTLYK